MHAEGPTRIPCVVLSKVIVRDFAKVLARLRPQIHGVAASPEANKKSGALGRAIVVSAGDDGGE